MPWCRNLASSKVCSYCREPETMKHFSGDDNLEIPITTPNILSFGASSKGFSLVTVRDDLYSFVQDSKRLECSRLYKFLQSRCSNNFPSFIHFQILKPLVAISISLLKGEKFLLWNSDPAILGQSPSVGMSQYGEEKKRKRRRRRGKGRKK